MNEQARVADVATPVRVPKTAELVASHLRRQIVRGELKEGDALPPEAALSRDEAESAIAKAVADSETAGIHGPAATPYVLARVAELTHGRSVTANLALIENNARVAASIAVALAT